MADQTGRLDEKALEQSAIALCWQATNYDGTPDKTKWPFVSDAARADYMAKAQTVIAAYLYDDHGGDVTDQTDHEARVAEAYDLAYVAGIDADKSPKYLDALIAAVAARERAKCQKEMQDAIAYAERHDTGPQGMDVYTKFRIAAIDALEPQA